MTSSGIPPCQNETKVSRAGGEVPNVQFLIESLGSGGAERQMTELAAGLARRGGSVQIICWGREKFYVAALDVPGIDVIFIPRKSRLDIRPLLFAVKWLAKGEDHLVHGFLDTGNLWAALASLLAGKRRAVASHRTSWQRLPILTRMHKAFSHHVAPITITNSYAGKKALMDSLQLREDRIHVIRNGIDLRKFNPATEWERIRIRVELGWKPETLICLTVATLYPVKNYRGYLEAISKADPGPHVHFVWCGNASPTELVRAQEEARRLDVADRVTFMERRSDIERLYAAADVFVLFSNREGFPNVVLEAMASGLPVIASDVGDVPQVLTGSLAEGLVRASNTDDLAGVLTRLLSEEPVLRRRRGAASRRRIEEMHLDVETMVDLHLSAYRAVLIGRGIPR